MIIFPDSTTLDVQIWFLFSLNIHGMNVLKIYVMQRTKYVHIWTF